MPGALTFGSGVKFSRPQQIWITQLRAALDPAVPLHVTSGTQSVEGQVTNILTKYKSGGPQEILDTYGKTVGGRFLAAPATVQAWSAVFVQAKRDGLLPPGHTEGMALDLRIRDLSEPQISALIAAIQRVGGIAVREKIPPHIHARLPAALAQTATAGPPITVPATTSKLPAWPFALTFGGVVLYALWTLWKRSR